MKRGSLAALPLIAACAHAGPAPVAPPPPAPPPAAPAPAPVRYFHASPDDGFWVSRSPALDRVVAAGARLELGPGGEVTGAAWDTNLTRRHEPLLGALAVPERLGGGFVHWTHGRVFRSREFTGPLSPIPLGVPGEVTVRGVRAGLASVMVFTDAGPRELLPGAARLTAPRDPALLDVVAPSAERAARLDVFGRLGFTGDGGAHWKDLSTATSLAVRALSAGPNNELWIEDWQGRFLIGPQGQLEPADAADRNISYDQPRGFQTVWTSAREREDWPWALRQTSPLAVAVAAGADVGDGTAFGVVQGAVVRVELATGKLLSLDTDILPGGLRCQPLRAPDGVLFACVWERHQGYGGYVFRSVRGGPPELERSFGEDGTFVAADDGALGYVGGCKAEARYLDPNDQSRWEVPRDTHPRPVVCVRRSPGEWVERRVDPGEGATLIAWVPRLDGTAAALALSRDPLPPPAGAPRVIEQGGVRLVRVYPEVPAWEARRSYWYTDRAGLSGSVDRRFRVRDDGSIDGWLLRQNARNEPGAFAVSLDPAGLPTVHDPAPGAMEVVHGGSFALAMTRDGALYESTDHGRTWRPAGRSLLPWTVPGSHACSALGCVIGPLVRAGWGDGAPEPLVSAEPLDPPEPTPPPRLVCVPRGAPVPVAAPPPAPPGNRTTLSTGWGDTLELVRDANVPEPAPPPARGAPPPVAPGPTAPAPLKKPPRASPAVLRTHTLLVRQPFAPFAAPRRLNATDASLSVHRRTLVVPLLAPSGDVDILVGGEQTELLVSGDRISVIPAFDTRRWYYGDTSGITGLALPGGRALVLGDARRRLTLEDHGPGPTTPPIFLGEQGRLRRRPFALARRDDGTVGILVADGGAPETAGVSIVDRLAGSVRASERLAPWSTVVTADDPRCKPGADPRAFVALVVIDASTWLALDPAALPGITLAREGLLRVRWGAERVCLEGIDASAIDANRRGEQARRWTLVARWSGQKERGAALRAGDVRQELVCRMAGGEGKGGR